MKNLNYFVHFLFGAIMLTSATPAGNDGALEAQVNTLKQECKELISSTRYEGSKITYFNLGKEKQNKSIELFMFLTNEYQFAISTKKCTAPVTVRVYDAAPDVQERTLIKEFKNVQGKNFSFSSDDLNKIYRKKAPEVERLKNIHIDYAIGSGKVNKEAIVLVYGNKA